MANVEVHYSHLIVAGRDYQVEHVDVAALLPEYVRVTSVRLRRPPEHGVGLKEVAPHFEEDALSLVETEAVLSQLAVVIRHHSNQWV